MRGQSPGVFPRDTRPRLPGAAGTAHIGNVPADARLRNLNPTTDRNAVIRHARETAAKAPALTAAQLRRLARLFHR